MSAQPVSNVIAFPGVKERSLHMLREAIWTLDHGDLTRAAIIIAKLADDAIREKDETDFYERVKACYAIFERILIEGNRL